MHIPSSQQINGPHSPLWKRSTVVTDMAKAPAQYGKDLELDFSGKAVVRALLVNQTLFMALPDILVACNYNDYAARHVHRESFPAFGKLVARETEDPEMPLEANTTVFLSPTGVYYWSQGVTCTDKVTGFTAWARREARRLCPNPTPGDPEFYLTLAKEPDGWTHIPPGPPSKYSGWKAEWVDLKDGDTQAWKAAQAENAEWNRKVREEQEAQRIVQEENGDLPKRLTLADVLSPAWAAPKGSLAASQV